MSCFEKKKKGARKEQQTLFLRHSNLVRLVKSVSQSPLFVSDYYFLQLLQEVHPFSALASPKVSTHTTPRRESLLGVSSSEKLKAEYQIKNSLTSSGPMDHGNP